MTKRSFSLLELLVVLVILAMLSTLVGIKINASIRERNFQESYKLLVDKVNLVKKLAKITQGGITLILEKQDVQIVTSLDGEALPSTQLKAALLVKQKLSGISNIRLFDTHDSSVELPIALTFYQNGCCYTRSEIDPKVRLEVVPAYSQVNSRFIDVASSDDDESANEAEQLFPLKENK